MKKIIKFFLGYWFIFNKLVNGEKFFTGLIDRLLSANRETKIKMSFSHGIHRQLKMLFEHSGLPKLKLSFFIRFTQAQCTILLLLFDRKIRVSQDGSVILKALPKVPAKLGKEQTSDQYCPNGGRAFLDSVESRKELYRRCFFVFIQNLK